MPTRISKLIRRDYIISISSGKRRIALVEQELGYKLPASYIEFMRLHNGGISKRTCYPTTEPTCWAQDHVAIHGFYRIGRGSHSGEWVSRFMIDEWGYPDTGVYICATPTAGHDMILLDYADCERDGDTFCPLAKTRYGKIDGKQEIDSKSPLNSVKVR